MTPGAERSEVKKRIDDYMERERLKPDLGDFTLMEYQEKVLLYGFLMVNYLLSLQAGNFISKLR